MTNNNTYPRIEWVDVLTSKGVKRLNPVLSREFIQAAYVDMNLSRVSLAEVYGISEKVFHNSYWHWFTAEERKVIGGTKIKLAQTTKNSNRHNTGKLKVVLDQEILNTYLDNKYSLERMARELKVAPQTVKANLEYYGLAKKLIIGGIDYKTVLTVRSLDTIIGTTLLTKLENLNNRDVTLACKEEIIEELLSMETSLSTLRQDLASLVRSTKYRLESMGHNADKLKLPSSKLNSIVKSILIELGYKVTGEFKIEDKYFDFLFDNTKILLEVDSGQYHSHPIHISNDKIKTELAESKGYTLIRLPVGKDKRTTIKNKLESCLKNLRLNQ